MLLVPYFWKSCDITKQLGIFLSKGGNSIWDLQNIESHDEIINVLEENDFPVTKLTYRNGIVYAEIDFDQLCLSDFYLNTDPDVSEKDVWQLFDIPASVVSCKGFEDISRILTGTAKCQS
jgi:hypothetical protein